MRIIRTEKLGSGPRGEVKAVSGHEHKICDCCGRKIRKLAHMDNGSILGEDCALLATRSDIRNLAWNRNNPRTCNPIAAFLAKHGECY